MANRRDAGVFKLENGCWAYRFTVKVDGETITRRKTVDDNGLKFRTKTDAIKAREAALQDAIAQRVKKKPIYRHTIKEVFEEFCESGRTDRAYRTIQKQDSLWRNHLCERFGKRFCDDVSSAEVIDYLSELYFVEGVDHQLTIFIADLKRFPHIGRAGEDLRSELVEAEAASNSLEHLREDDVVGVRFQTPFA